MDDEIVLSNFGDNAPVITIATSEREIDVRVFFSLNCCQQMFERHEQGDDYRSAFTKAIFQMYEQTNHENTSIREQDFLSVTDEHLIRVLNAILKQDGALNSEYENVQSNDVYERFYKANELLLKRATAGISKSLVKMSETFASQNKALSSSLERAMKNLVKPPDYLSGLTSAISDMPKLNIAGMHSALSEISKMPMLEITSAIQQIDFPQLQSALANMPQIQFPELASAIANIPKPVFDVTAFVAPLQSLSESIRHFNADLAVTLQTSLLQIAEAARSVVSSIDFSLLTYRNKWSKQRETLLTYEWFYSDELPDDLVDYIHDRREELNIDEVDKLIVDCFRANRCKALKSIIGRWNNLPYFSCRKRVFHEALVNHSRRYFNSSVTLLTIHTEGVITDFVRASLESPRFKVEKAIEDIKRELENNEEISIAEYEVFSDVITQIELAFTENFKHSDPDATSNKSRHKIAHGHAYEAENEVNSLKRFLYLNEIYYLFSLLHKQG